MKLIIEDDEGRKTVVPLVREEITIGRQDGNTIRLTERNVSRRHARLVRNNGSILIEDLGSYNGVRVNGEKIQGPTRIKEGDLVEIGDYDLGVEGKFDATATPAAGVPRQGTLPPSQMSRPAQKQPTLPPAPPPVAPRPQETAPAPAPQAANSPADAGATAIIRVSDIMALPQVEARDLLRSEMPRLVGLAGQFRGKEFYLTRTEMKFGRTEENDIVVDHQSVSRSHARFVLDGGQWKVIDNKSANGVRINGEDYAISNLKPGDVIELGHLKFRFCAPGEKFTPPKDAAEEGQGRGGLKPTTAELIAGAQGRGPSAAAAKKPAMPVALVAGIAGAVVVAGTVAFFLLRGGSGQSESGEPVGAGAVKQGDALFKQHKYRAAAEKYELAGDAPAPNKKKATDEARGEEVYGSMKQAIEAGDGDKARNLFEKCSAESGYWCQKAAELKEQVAGAYARKHLAAASAAKTAGQLEQCQAEAGNVIGFDPANAEAQSLQSQCQPKAAVEPRPAPEKREGPSVKDREAKAARLAKLASDKLNAREFKEAAKDASAALAQNPADKATHASAWRTLGYANAYLGDIPAAKKYLKLYKPFCAADCAQVEAFLAR